jgi:hypothetical protein
MNATTVSFLGLRRRQRAQDLLREGSRKAPRKALRRAPASQCARASQSAIRIAAIASVHVNCTTQSRVTLIHCIAHQLLVIWWLGRFWRCLPRRAKEALARVSEWDTAHHTYPYGAAPNFRRGLGLFHIGVRKHVQVDTTLTNPLQSQTLGQKGKISRLEVVPGIAVHQIRQQSVSDTVPL